MTVEIAATLYNGKYRVELNKAHRYRVGKVDGDDVLWTDPSPDGVTGICSSIPKYLEDWAGRVDVDRIKEIYVNYMNEHGAPPEITSFLTMCDDAKQYHINLRDAAGDRGSEAHKIIEKILTTQPYEPPTDPKVAASLVAFNKWRETDMCEILEAERLIYHDDLYYCGTTDVWGKINGQHVVMDFKTGSGFYDDHPYQLTGYACALEKEFPIRVDMGYIVHLDKLTSDYKLYPVRIDDAMREAWCNLVLHHKTLKRVRKMVKELKNAL